MEDEAPTTYQIDSEGRVIQVQGGEVAPSPAPIDNGTEGSAEESSTATEVWYKQTGK